MEPARAQLMWFMVVSENPQVADLVRDGQARLAGLPGLDFVPQEWLHITTLIAGFSDAITSDQVNAMTYHARRILARIPPVKVTIGRVLYHPRAIMLAARPSDALEPVLQAARDATRIATGYDGTLYRAPWIPHVTLAYSNSVRPAAPAIKALGLELPQRQISIDSIDLVSQAPEQLWTWHPVSHVLFEPGLPLPAGDGRGPADGPRPSR